MKGNPFKMKGREAFNLEKETQGSPGRPSSDPPTSSDKHYAQKWSLQQLFVKLNPGTRQEGQGGPGKPKEAQGAPGRTKASESLIKA